LAKLGDRIRAERRRQFVGRRDELALFEEILRASELPAIVLSVYGPGGVGKTTLLRQLEALCATHAVRCVTLDARNLQPNPDAFLLALCEATGCAAPEDAVSALGGEGRTVVFVDTYEAIQPLDGWIREGFVPDLPDNVLVVLLGRKRPTSGWRSDVWQTLCRTLPLRNLSDDEARSYLEAQAVPQEAYPDILEFTHGYPLALSLVADNYAQKGSLALGSDPAPDMIALLLERLMESVEEPLHRDLLEVSALVRMTTEAIIAEVVDSRRATELFEWLRSLSFIEVTPLGLMPHDLARDAIATELRWRNTDRYSELHHRARSYYSNRLDRATGPAQQAILFDYIYLHRDNPVVKPFFQWHSHGGAFLDAARPEDLPEILRMVDRHEGPESAKLAAHWFEHQPEAFFVLRGAAGADPLHGLLVKLDLGTAREHADGDPACLAALSYLDAKAPLRAGERATHFRFWMADEEYQSVSPSQSLLFVTVVQHYLTQPGLAATFLPCSDPAFWQPMFDYAMHGELKEAEFHVGGHRYGVFFSDWRVLPPKPWLALLSEREVPIKEAPQAHRPTPDVVVLSREGFEDSVHEALKAFSNDSRLAKSPLLRSRLVVDRLSGEAGTKERIEVLRELLKQAAQSMNTNVRDARLYHALDTCYLRPLRSQEMAAEKLDVSIATYRRHLKAGLERLTDLLWQQETGI